MFTLRSIWNGKNPVYNQSLGNFYTVYYKDNEREWDHHCSEMGLTPESKKNCFGFIRSVGASEQIPLYFDVEYYVMSENGRTFENLTQRT